MAIAATTWKQDDLQSLQSLQERVRPMVAGVDLASEMTERVESAIAFGELGGAAASDGFKKLMILWDRGDISGEELEQLIQADAEQERMTEEAINNVIGTMAIEGFELSDADIARGRRILQGTVGVDEIVDQLIEHHQAVADADNQKKEAG